MRETVIVLDFGGQYNQLIARRVREQNVYCEILPFNTDIEVINEKAPIGLIFTGGPKSVYAPDAPQVEKEIFSLGVPILGICYGSQLIGRHYGGKVERSKSGQYGKTDITYRTTHPLFDGMDEHSVCWMSHMDAVTVAPEWFEVLASTDTCPVAAFGSESRGLYGVQFHPEVMHTKNGTRILRNFLYNICGAKGDWTMAKYAATALKELCEKIGTKKVLLALSGGVDSSVAAALLSRAVGENLTCIFVDHGLLRKNEGDEVEAAFAGEPGMKFIRVNAQKQFLSKLAGVSEPEAKRKIIGEEFIRGV